MKILQLEDALVPYNIITDAFRLLFLKAIEIVKRIVTDKIDNNLVQ